MESRKIELIVLNELRYTAINFGNWLLLLSSSLTVPIAILCSIHRVPKKTKQICFCQNFVKFPPILIIFGRKMGNDPDICEVHSFSTSPNLRHHLTVLNANVPNCYITPNVVICNKPLTT